MRFKAHTYQARAISWVEAHPRCLLFLDMGLGKSVITLTAVQNLMRYGEVSRVLVIAPKKVAESTWSTEAEKWDHLDLKVSIVSGTMADRLRALDRASDVYVISRDNVAWLVNHYGNKFPFDMVVIDELTSFKNSRSLRFKALRRVMGGVSRVVGLTGTPTPNGLPDLWAQVYCIDGGERLGRFLTRFRTRWFNTREHNHIIIRIWPKEGAEEEIMSLISDIALTMRAEDWLELPELIEREVRVSLPEKVQAGYRQFEKECVMDSIKKEERITAASAAALCTKLSQYANGAVYTDNGAVREIHAEKLEMLSEIIESAGGAVLVFYQFKHDCERILKRFREAQVYKGPQELLDWNNGKIRILLAHPASTAFGLNMQHGGHTIVWFSTGWNLELYQQANARLHRQGQTRPVVVHKLIAEKTVDERMNEAISGKGMSQERFLKGMADRLSCM